MFMKHDRLCETYRGLSKCVCKDLEVIRRDERRILLDLTNKYNILRVTDMSVPPKVISIALDGKFIRELEK